MKFKIKVGNLKRLVEAVLREQDDEEAPKQGPLESASLDDQVDKYLINFEKKLTEADEKAQVQPNAKPASLDVHHYAKGVARLYQNYDSLFDIPNTIYRRAINFVKQNYDEETSNALEKVLADELNVGPNVRNLDDIEAPSGGLASPVDISGGGAGGV
jgi:hypothetical protein